MPKFESSQINQPPLTLLFNNVSIIKVIKTMEIEVEIGKKDQIEHFCPKINIFHRIPSPEHFNFSKENPFFFFAFLSV